MTTTSATLTDSQRAAFERDGFLLVRDALPPATVTALTAALDRLYRAENVAANRSWQMRNCIGADPAFLDLLDFPATFPLIVDLLGPNIQMMTSHAIIRQPAPVGDPAREKLADGWHRDGGTSSAEMGEPHPRILIKIAYLLSDHSQPGRGNTRVLPGSHRLVGRPAQAEGALDPYGAIEICGNPGDALIFEQRTWHAVGPNLSDIVRKSVFFGYGYRWLRPMDYVVQSPELLARATPIQRQLLGDAATELGYYIPTDNDIPLRAWQAERRAASNQTA